MRTVETKVYKIDDHPEPELCYQWIRNNWHDLADNCREEMISSLKELSRQINGTLDYSISCSADRGESVQLKDYNQAKLLALYKSREECPLTGVCYDIDVIEGLFKDDLEERVLRVVHNETEYLYSDEGLQEMCQANEYEFLECGSFYSE